MRISIIAYLLIVVAVPAAAQQAFRAEVAVGYSYAYANAPPSNCGCFSMNGGFGSAAWQVKPALALVGEVTATHASNVISAGQSLTLTSVMFGPRWSFRPKRPRGKRSAVHRLTPFVQTVLGVAHASGALSGTASGSSNGFAWAAGGGLDLELSHRLSWRMFQGEYLFTRIPNGVNDRQNIFRLRSGLVIHW